MVSDNEELAARVEVEVSREFSVAGLDVDQTQGARVGVSLEHCN